MNCIGLSFRCVTLPCVSVCRAPLFLRLQPPVIGSDPDFVWKWSEVDYVQVCLCTTRVVFVLPFPQMASKGRTEVWQNFIPITMAPCGKWVRVKCKWCSWGQTGGGVSANVTRLAAHVSKYHTGLKELLGSDGEGDDPVPADEEPEVIEAATSSQSTQPSQSSSEQYAPSLVTVTLCVLLCAGPPKRSQGWRNDHSCNTETGNSNGGSRSALRNAWLCGSWHMA